MLVSALKKHSGAVGGRVRHQLGMKLVRADYKILPLVYDAMSHNEVLRITYLKAGERQSGTRDIHPLSICHARKQWNVYAYDLLRGDYRTFVLRRMPRAKRTGARLVRSPDFDAAEVIRYNVGAYTGKGKHPSHRPRRARLVNAGRVSCARDPEAREADVYENARRPHRDDAAREQPVRDRTRHLRVRRPRRSPRPHPNCASA